MSDHCEEQEMEAEALAAIFDNAFEIIDHSQPFKWSIKLLPVDCAGNEIEEEAQNFVGIKLLATIPENYPESLPDLEVEIIKGLTEDHREKLLAMAIEESQNNEGMPAIFAICEVLREWLLDNNTKGLDDASMHAAFFRKVKEEEQKKVRITDLLLKSFRKMFRFITIHGPSWYKMKDCLTSACDIKCSVKIPYRLSSLCDRRKRDCYTDLPLWDNNCSNIQLYLTFFICRNLQSESSRLKRRRRN